MTDFEKEAHMLAAMFAMNGYIAAGMRPENLADASYAAADELMAKYKTGAGIVAALKPKRSRK
jgi:hypothetical protein